MARSRFSFFSLAALLVGGCSVDESSRRGQDSAHGAAPGTSSEGFNINNGAPTTANDGVGFLLHEDRKCSAVEIKDRCLLTAASCIPQYEGSSNLFFYMQATDPWPNGRTGSIVNAVPSFRAPYLHPLYSPTGTGNSSARYHDLALIWMHPKGCTGMTDALFDSCQDLTGLNPEATNVFDVTWNPITPVVDSANYPDDDDSMIIKGYGFTSPSEIAENRPIKRQGNVHLDDIYNAWDATGSYIYSYESDLEHYIVGADRGGATLFNNTLVGTNIQEGDEWLGTRYMYSTSYLGSSNATFVTTTAERYCQKIVNFFVSVFPEDSGRISGSADDNYVHDLEKLNIDCGYGHETSTEICSLAHVRSAEIQAEAREGWVFDHWESKDLQNLCPCAGSDVKECSFGQSAITYQMEVNSINCRAVFRSEDEPCTMPSPQPSTSPESPDPSTSPTQTPDPSESSEPCVTPEASTTPTSTPTPTPTSTATPTATSEPSLSPSASPESTLPPSPSATPAWCPDLDYPTPMSCIEGCLSNGSCVEGPGGPSNMCCWP